MVVSPSRRLHSLFTISSLSYNIPCSSHVSWVSPRLSLLLNRPLYPRLSIHSPCPHVPSTPLLPVAIVAALSRVIAVVSLKWSLIPDWGHHTGTIDWCETNYSHSRYIAEFVNTLTNIPSISLGLYGLYHTRKNGIPLRYGLCFLGLSMIGVGSFGFHASLKWEWQLMDELPMVCLLGWRGGRSGIKKRLLVEGRRELMVDLPGYLCWIFVTWYLTKLWT